MKKALLLCCFLVAGPLVAHAQYGSYTSEDAEDGDIDIEIVVSPAGGGTCPSGLSVESFLPGAPTAIVSADYPNTATLFQTAQNAGTATIEWNRYYAILGEQRGGNCGEIASHTVSELLHIAYTNYELVSFRNGVCTYSADCDTATICSKANPQITALPANGDSSQCLAYYQTEDLVITVAGVQSCPVGLGTMYNSRQNCTN